MLPTYLPSGTFAFKRSYVAGLWVRHDTGVLTFTDGLLTFIVAGSPDAVVKVYFKPEFVDWSSNRRTLDWIIEDATYEYPPNPTTHPLPFFAYWIVSPNPPRNCIGIDAMYGSTYTFIELPPAPPTYWLPPPL